MRKACEWNHHQHHVYSGSMGLPFRGAYSASKGALNIILRLCVWKLRSRNSSLDLAPGDYATDIASRRYHEAVIENSPYKSTYQESLDTMDTHVDSGNDPMEDC